MKTLNIFGKFERITDMRSKGKYKSPWLVGQN